MKKVSSGISAVLPIGLFLGGVLLSALTSAQQFSANESRSLSLLAAAQAGDEQAALVLLDGVTDVDFPEADGTTALHWSVLNNDLVLTGALLRAGADVDARSRYGITAIYLAAQNGEADMLNALIAAGANPNEVFNENETVLMTAARTGDYETVKSLLDAGAEVDARENWHGQTALMWAVAQGNANLIELLVAYGADVNASSAFEEWERQVTDEPRAKWLPQGVMTPLLFAAREGCVNCIDLLLEQGAEIDAVTPNGISALLIAIINGHYDVAWRLVKQGADVNIIDDTARSPLYAAVHFNIMPESNRPSPQVAHNDHSAYELIELLLQSGANVNQQLISMIPFRLKLDRGTDSMLMAGTSPFLRAAKSADVAVMKLLIEYGADPTLTTTQLVNPLMTAANLATSESDTTGRYKTQQQMIEAIQICLDLGLDINAKSDMGRTAVFGAAMFGMTDVVKFLAANGAVIDYKDNRGLSPLSAAMGQAGGYGFVGTDGVFHEDTVEFISSL